MGSRDKKKKHTSLPTLSSKTVCVDLAPRAVNCGHVIQSHATRNTDNRKAQKMCITCEDQYTHKNHIGEFCFVIG